VTLRFGRIVPASVSTASDTETTVPTQRRPPLTRFSRVAPASLAAAAEQGHALVARAEAKAAEILQQASAEASALREHAAAEARAEVAASFAMRELTLAARERAVLEASTERLIACARLLAERLLGEALDLDPARVTALARQALTEAHGSRQVTLLAHPADVPLLEAALTRGELKVVTRVVADPARSRGNLRLQTEAGTLDAELAPQLERLSQKLGEALKHG
jgi:flagellar biosynthesis/type III secretory pathway protein FliH